MRRENGGYVGFASMFDVLFAMTMPSDGVYASLAHVHPAAATTPAFVNIVLRFASIDPARLLAGVAGCCCSCYPKRSRYFPTIRCSVVGD